MPASPTQLGPVRSGERAVSVDVLRGVALLGILLMNIYAFGLPWPAYANPLLGGGTAAADLGTWWFTHLFAEMKFMSIFSMLFGAGLALMTARADSEGRAGFGRIYYRRLAWLLLIGLVHSYLMWFGDILFSYAVAGAVIYPLRRLRPRIQIWLGAAVVSVGAVVLVVVFGWIVMPLVGQGAAEAVAAREAGEELTEAQDEMIEAWHEMNPTPEMLEEETRVYRGSDWWAQVRYRAGMVLLFQTVMLALFVFWRVAGLMLIGMALARLGVFSAERSTRFYGLCCGVGYGVGLPLVWLGGLGLQSSGFDAFHANRGGCVPNYFASIAVAFGHVGVVMLAYRAGRARWLLTRLAAVGRLALTHYLMQTVLCTTFFYGWGLGQFARLSRFELMGIVLVVWVVQLAVSPAWLRRYRFGPAEWLWRSLTYLRWQPMR